MASRVCSKAENDQVENTVAEKLKLNKMSFRLLPSSTGHGSSHARRRNRARRSHGQPPCSLRRVPPGPPPRGRAKVEVDATEVHHGLEERCAGRRSRLQVRSWGFWRAKLGGPDTIQ